MDNKVINLTDYKSILPEDIDSFDSGTIVERNNNDLNYNGNGGGSDMDKYATKGELKTLETKIDGQFNTLNAKLDGQFKSNDIKLDNLNKQLDNQNNQIRTSKNWFMGIMSGLIVALVIAVLKKVFLG